MATNNKNRVINASGGHTTQDAKMVKKDKKSEYAIVPLCVHIAFFAVEKGLLLRIN